MYDGPTRDFSLPGILTTRLTRRSSPDNISTKDKKGRSSEDVKKAFAVFQLNCREKIMAKKIVESDSPILFISESNAESYGSMAKLIADTLNNMPVIFETDLAKKNFLNKTGVERPYFENMTIGVAEISNKKNGYDHSVFLSSDCILVLGSPQENTRDALMRLQGINRAIIVNEKLQTSIDRPQARANFAKIENMSQRPRSGGWSKQATQMHRPCIA